jgi:glyoxylase-like metal-dependent hydrolase (beta-lactamase superfamily II)
VPSSKDSALADGELVELGNTLIEAIATPGHAPAHHSYLVTDHRRGDEPWFVLTGVSMPWLAGLSSIGFALRLLPPGS